MTPSRLARLLAVAGLVGCGVPEPTVTVSEEVVTVATATWTHATDRRTRVEVDSPDGPWLVTDWAAHDGEAEVDLVGLLADTEYTARVVEEGGDAGPAVAFTTGSLPNHIPAWTVSGAPGWEGYLVTSVLGADPAPSVIVVLDEEGRVVWYHQSRQGHRVLRARLRPDGTGVRYGEIEPSADPRTSGLVSVDWRGNETHRVDVPHFTHDFVDTPEGDAACILVDTRPGRTGTDVLGDSLAVVTDAGDITPFWSIWDNHTPPPDDELTQQTWTHANALGWNEAAGTYWLGMRELSALLEIHPDGTEGRQLGGDDSTWVYTDPADATKWQHQFQFLDDGILIFDDRDPSTGEDSRVLELALDDAAGTATKTWEWHHEPPLQVVTLGDVNRAEDGSTLAVFSYSGVIDDIGPDGELRWELATSFATVIPYIVRLPALPGVTRVR